MRTLFFGTPDIAVPALESLRQTTDLVGVVCQPDRRAGRGMTLTAPATKTHALAHGLPVHQPRRVRDEAFAAWVREQHVDYAVVIAYGRILPRAVLEAPRGGCLNLHASLLPKYRGAAPIQWAIVRGETETGVCLMQMDEGMDTGPVLARRTIPIGPDETAGELGARIATLAATVVREDLPRAPTLSAVAQDHDAATSAPMLSRSDGRIDWTAPAVEVHDHVRGMTPWPGAHTTLGDAPLKILRTTRVQEPVDGAEPAPGTVRTVGKKRVLIACGSGWVDLQRAQRPGRKALGPADLLGGRVLCDGDQLV
ncbi:MAG: methionyl-tRNA formyltransferase [Myxococcota bacterium]